MKMFEISEGVYLQPRLFEVNEVVFLISPRFTPNHLYYIGLLLIKLYISKTNGLKSRY